MCVSSSRTWHTCSGWSRHADRRSLAADPGCAVADWLASEGVVDLILALVLLEWLVLAGLHRVTGRGLAPADLAGFLLSGVFLLLALRAALVDAWWGWVNLCLAGSLLTHLVDLARRWKARGRDSTR